MRTLNKTWLNLCHKYNYRPFGIERRPTTENILVTIASRNRVSMLDDTIKMLYSTCASKDNFDILCLVDDDQKEPYRSVRDRYPETIWKYPPHIRSHWGSFTDARYDFVSENNYYFVWSLSDDIKHLSHGWDAKILDKKDHFKDEIFVLHQNRHQHPGRVKSQEVCYIDNESERLRRAGDMDRYYQRISHDILHCNEFLPVFTSRFLELMHPIFNGGQYTTGPCLVTGAIVAMLKSKYGEDRHVTCDISYKITDQRASGKYRDIIIDGKKMTRDEAYPIWSHQRRFSIIMPTVEKMNYIIECSRDCYS